MNNKKIIINSLEEIKNMGKFWESRFREDIHNVGFPIDFHKSDDYKRKIVIQKVNSNLCDKLINITNNDNLSIYIFMITILKIELSMYNNNNNLVVGSPVYLKTEGKIVPNKILPLISSLNSDMSFKEALLSVKRVIQEAYANQIYPIKEVFKDTNIDFITDILPINCAMKNLHTEKNIKEIIDSIKNEITFLIERKESSIFLEVNYNSVLFKEDTIKRINKHYMNIMEQIFDNLDMKISEIELMNKRERNQILYEFNDTNADYPKDKTIQEIFEEQVEKTPNNIAVIFNDKELTYKELNEKANSLARVLRKKGIKADSIVGIMVERSLEMIIGIMAILKAGGAYLPIDPSYPAERIEYMLKDSETNLVISEGKYESIQGFNGEIINIKSNDIYDLDTNNLQNKSKSNNLAYVIYTSGSTGKPKGAMIEHASLVNRINWMQKKYPLHHSDVILQKTTYTFDVSVWELLWWSLVGAKVCMLEPGQEKDPIFINKVIELNEVTTIHFVPSMLNAFIDCIQNECELKKIKTLKKIFCSGEAITIQQVEKLRSIIGKTYDIKLINLYGPTEATIDVTYFECFTEKYEKSIPIGKPIDNTRIYIVNKNNRLQPIGLDGELCISGDGLSRGYLNRAELTSEKFVENPFESTKKMYKTGDLARWLPDGNIQFLGRIDNQVKVRGFRIEVGEIEVQLQKHEEIKESVVLDLKDRNDNQYLCAYIVGNRGLSSLELREYLKITLPEYMIPSYFVNLDKMPLTLNGKINRKALPNPKQMVNVDKIYESPQYETEVKLLKIWKKTLDMDDISINDNFFDIGGNSMLAVYLQKRIMDEFNLNFPLVDLYRHPTIKLFNKKITKTIEKEGNFFKIENKLKNKFNKKFKIKKCVLDSKEYIILFTDAKYEKIFEYMLKEIPVENFPHYIKPIELLSSDYSDDKTDNYVMDYNDLNLLDNFENGKNSIKEVEKFFANIVNTQLDNLNSIIKFVDINEKYLGSYLQNDYIKNEFRSVITTEIDINDEPRFENISNTIIELINGNALLRTKIIVEEDGVQFIEHNKITKLKLEVVDISKYTDKNINFIKNKLIDYSNHILCNQTPINKILYNIIILKKNEKDFSIIFNFDHNIFDAASKKILKLNFFDCYDSIQNSNYKRNGIMKTYKDYVEMGKNNTNTEKIEKYKMSKSYTQYFDVVNRMFLKYKSNSKYLQYSEAINLEYYFDEDMEYDVPIGDRKFAISLYYSMKICSILFEENMIPVNILRDGRVYEKRSFHNLIGDCHVVLPVLCNTDTVNNCYKELDIIENEFFAKDKLHFGYATDKLCGDKELSEITRKNFIRFNYIGEISKEEEEVILKNKKLNFPPTKYRIHAYSIKNKIGIILFNGIKMEKIEEIKNIKRI